MPPAAAQPRRGIAIPPALLRPGMEMLKVSVKSARRVKSRRLWLELPVDGKDTVGDASLGHRAMTNVRICWEKNWRGVGLTTQASIPLSSVRDVRFGSTGSPYRTALHLSPSVEPKWMTIIYVAPTTSASPLALLGAAGSGASYKLVHFIAPSPEALELWRNVFERVKEGRGIREGVVWRDDVEWVEEAEKEAGKVVKADEVHKLCARLGMGMGKEEIKMAFKATAGPLDHLDFAGFQKFVKLLKRREDVEDVFREASGGAPAGLSAADWSRFLRETQKSTLDQMTLQNLYTKYADPASGSVLLDGFLQFLLSSDNSAIRDESGQDMTRPLTEYYISSSHNTYLLGNQVAGEATIEGYIRALQQGCRCVELDVWSGDDGFPVITHGRTLTSKILASDAIAAIAQYAFLASVFPVILSLEVHCDVVQQERLVEIFRTTLGDRLLDKRVDRDAGVGEIEHLPSPWELRGKVILKGKKLAPPSITGAPIVGAPGEVDLSSSTESSSSTSSDSDLRRRVIRAVRRSFDTRPSPPLSLSLPSPSPNRTPLASPSPRSPSFPPPPPSSSSPTVSPLLSSLLVYTIGTKSRGFNKKEIYAPTDVVSLGEKTVFKMLRDEGARQDFIGHNRAHLVRAYPKGSRVTSSNFLPMGVWAGGVQCVAMNWQRFDVGMELNMAMFTRAGRSGYVLKPELLRRKGGEKDKESLGRTANFLFDLEVISAQQLPRTRESSDPESTSLDPFVEVSLYVPGLAAPLKRRSKVISSNAFHPLFKSQFTIPFTTHPAPGMLDLVFLRFEVLDARGSVKAASEEGGKGEFVASYTTSLGGLMPGYRHVPLYDGMGDQHLFSSLFIRSCVRAAEGDAGGAVG